MWGMMDVVGWCEGPWGVEAEDVGNEVWECLICLRGAGFEPRGLYGGVVCLTLTAAARAAGLGAV